MNERPLRLFANWLSLAIILLLANNVDSYQCRPKNNNFPLEYVYEFAHTDKDLERRIAYWREDPSFGATHLNFHYAFPFWIPKAVANIMMDRAGECFYYYHHQITSRYDTERISLHLPKVIPLSNFDDPIPEAYFPNFPPLATEYMYQGRPANMTLTDVPGKFLVSELKLWRDRIVEAAKFGYIIHQNGTKLQINNAEGINLLNEVGQSTVESPNHRYYGCFHSYFHFLSGRISDPKEKYHNNFDIMGQDLTLNVMDPLFYRFHKYVRDISLLHKSRLPRYDANELGWNDVKLTSISVFGDLTKSKNQLRTFSKQWKPLMKHGMDFKTDIPVKVLFRILQHEEFIYNLTVENLSTQSMTAAVRVFLAPVYDENGSKIPFQEQRMLYSELDKFKVALQPGHQTIVRHSKESSVTLSPEKSTEVFSSLPNPAIGLPNPNINPCFWSHLYANDSNDNIEEKLTVLLTPKIAYTNCGWPHNLLLPRGKKGGMEFVLFAMLTNWQDDKVRSHPEQDFSKGSAFCGIFNDTYPDKRNMGFPFDRPAPVGTTIDSFLLPNMAKTSIKIYHSDQVVPLNGTFDPSIK